MFSKTSLLTTRLASITCALTLTLAMLVSINMLATGEAHAQQLSADATSSARVQV